MTARLSRPLFLLLTAVMLALGTGYSTGCAGTAARQNVGVPAVLLASGGIEADASAGIATLPADQQAAATADLTAFDAALQTKDREIIAAEALPRWPLVKSWATAGILNKQATGKIGPNVANSLTNRLTQFDEVLVKITSK